MEAKRLERHNATDRADAEQEQRQQKGGQQDLISLQKGKDPDPHQQEIVKNNPSLIDTNDEGQCIIQDNCDLCGKNGTYACSECPSPPFYCGPNHVEKHWMLRHNNLGPSPPFLLERQNFLETGGMQMVAARDLEAGTVLLEEFPINFSLEYKPDNQIPKGLNCICCGLDIQLTNNELDQSNKCSSCGWPVCTVECGKASIHRDNECAVFSQNKIDFMSTPHLASESQKIGQHFLASFCTYMIRGLGLAKRNKKIFNQFMTLMHRHPVTESQDEIERSASRQFKWLERLICSPENFIKEDAVKIAKISLINSFSVGSNTISATYLRTSRLNHSCLPNCTRDFGPRPNFRIRIRTSVPVLEGDPLTISYFLDTEKGTRQRQGNILSHWGCGGFTCGCSLCGDPTEKGTFMSAIRCTNCLNNKNSMDGEEEEEDHKENIYLPKKIDQKLKIILDWHNLDKNVEQDTGYFLPINNDQQDDDWKCNGCGWTQKVSKLFPAVEELYLNLQFQKNYPQSRTQLMTFCETFLENGSGTLLHPNHWVLQEAAESIVECLQTILEVGDISQKNLEKYIKLLMYLLNIRNRTKPGLSSSRAKLLRQLSLALLTMVTKFGYKLTAKETQESLGLCQKFQTSCWDYMKGQLDMTEDNLLFLREIEEAKMLQQNTKS